MYIEKYNVTINDLHSKNVRRVKINANDAYDAHYEALKYCHSLNQEIYKIANYEGKIEYTLDKGFVNE
jgi:hypothetical protein